MVLPAALISRITTTLLVVCFVLAGFAPLARCGSTTQPTTAPAGFPQMSQWLDELASSDAAIREAARLHLMSLTRDDLPAVQEWLTSHANLAPSQSLALRPIVEQIYLAGEPYVKCDPPRGFLGIMMESGLFIDLQQPNENSQAPGVVVVGRLPGYCAARTLKDGDVILGTVNPTVTFTSSQELGNVVADMEPGTVVNLRVMRHGQLIKVPLTLDCKPAELEAAGSPDQFQARRAQEFEKYWQKTFAPLLHETVG